MALSQQQIVLLHNRTNEQINIFLRSKFENYNDEWNVECLEQFIYFYKHFVFSIQNEIAGQNEEDRKQIQGIVKNLFDFVYSQN